MTTKGREKDNRFIMLIRGLSVHFVAPFFGHLKELGPRFSYLSSFHRKEAP